MVGDAFCDLRFSSRLEALKSEVELQAESLKVAQIEYANKLKSLRDEFNRNRETLRELETNLEHTRATVELASKRYRSLEGPLIDVRESYAHLKSLETQRVQLLYSLAETSVVLKLLK